MTDINLGEGTNLGLCGGNTALGAGIGGFIGSWFGNGGFGWGNRGNLANDTLLGDEFIKRDLFNVYQNVSNTACQTQKEVLENRFNCSQNACNTQKEILESRYTTQLGFQNAQANLSNCCCDLKTIIHAEGEATRSMLQNDKIEQLRDQVYASNLALNNANLANTVINSVRPFPIPSYTVTSPYVGLYNPYNGCGCNNATII